MKNPNRDKRICGDCGWAGEKEQLAFLRSCPNCKSPSSQILYVGPDGYVSLDNKLCLSYEEKETMWATERMEAVEKDKPKTEFTDTW